MEKILRLILAHPFNIFTRVDENSHTQMSNRTLWAWAFSWHLNLKTDQLQSQPFYMDFIFQ